MSNSFLSPSEIGQIGLQAHPTACISRKASFYGGERIRVGRNSRIDDFCVLSAGPGGITIGDHVHLAVGVTLIGAAEISVGHFANLSGRVSIYSSNDDYSGEHMSNPTVDPTFTAVDSRPVRVGAHVIVGAGSVVLPGVVLHEGAVIGALSLVKRDAPAWTISVGCPAQVIKDRSRVLLQSAALHAVSTGDGQSCDDTVIHSENGPPGPRWADGIDLPAPSDRCPKAKRD